MTKYDIRLQPTTKLERAVCKSARSDSDGALRSHIRDVAHGGCQSGTVGGLIYTRDCVRFYKAHKAEIHALLREVLSDMGETSPQGLFGDKWDETDIFAEEDANQNLLAWFGYEETLRRLAANAGMDV